MRPATARSTAPKPPTERDIRVLYPDGSRAKDASYTEAHGMIRAGVARALDHGRRLRTIQLEDGPSRLRAGTRYSHCRAVEHVNPAGVWMLTRMPDDLVGVLEYRAVLISVKAYAYAPPDHHG